MAAMASPLRKFAGTLFRCMIRMPPSENAAMMKIIVDVVST